MKRFQVTLMIPQTQTIEATDLQGAHNHVSKMMTNQPEGDEIGPRVHSIIEIEAAEVIDFAPLDD